jgi:sulfate adenylyltransferase subunit 2
MDGLCCGQECHDLLTSRDTDKHRAVHSQRMDGFFYQPAPELGTMTALAPSRNTSVRARRSHLDYLESEAIYIMREVAAQFSHPIILFSGGKDSIVMVHLARLAFRPATAPFPLLHVDTGHNFPETIAFRDQLVSETGARLIVRTVQDSIDRKLCAEEPGENPSRNALQTVTLLDALRALRVDAAFGGGRRDEEKARAKERIFSHRDRHGQWNPRQQRPELWSLFNGRCARGEHFRVFPLSNWTELDIWQYIAREKLSLPSLYFAHERDVVARDGMLLSRGPYNTLLAGERYVRRTVRFRTVGDMTCTGAIESSAATVDDIVREVAAARVAERGTRGDDRRSESAMEDRKRLGYF